MAWSIRTGGISTTDDLGRQINAMEFITALKTLMNEHNNGQLKVLESNVDIDPQLSILYNDQVLRPATFHATNVLQHSCGIPDNMIDLIFSHRDWCKEK